MKMKARYYLPLAMTVSLLLGRSACLAESASLDDLDPVTITFATGNASANVESKGCEIFIDLVEEKSGGKITFDYSDGGVLGTITELVEGTINGVYDMTCTSPDWFQSYEPATGVVAFPCLIDSFEVGEKVYDGEVGEELRRMVHDSAGVTLLNYYWCGFRNVLTKKKVTSLDDAKGVLVRAPEVKTYIDLLDIMGFEPVTMSWSEVYTAMNSGVVDGAEAPVLTFYDQGFYDIGSNLLLTRHLFNTNCMMVNNDFFEGLSQEYQDILLECAQEATEQERQIAIDMENSYYDLMAEKGVSVNEWEEDSKEEVTRRFEEYWGTTVEGYGEAAKELLEKIQAAKE